MNIYGFFEKRCFLDLIGHVSPQISQVFNSPEQVTAKLIHSCYDEQIQVFTENYKYRFNILYAGVRIPPYKNMIL